MDRRDTPSPARRRRPASRLAVTAAALGLAAVSLAACGDDEPTELDRTHAYMDSLRVYLGDLRHMDDGVSQIVDADTLDATLIVPIIARNLHPTVSGLLLRASALQPTPAVQKAHELLLAYLETRREAYDAALRGNNEQRPELFELFARKQIEAQEIGRFLEDEAQRLRRQVPGYR